MHDNTASRKIAKFFSPGSEQTHPLRCQNYSLSRSSLPPGEIRIAARPVLNAPASCCESTCVSCRGYTAFLPPHLGSNKTTLEEQRSESPQPLDRGHNAEGMGAQPPPSSLCAIQPIVQLQNQAAASPPRPPRTPSLLDFFPPFQG